MPDDNWTRDELFTDIFGRRPGVDNIDGNEFAFDNSSNDNNRFTLDPAKGLSTQFGSSLHVTPSHEASQKSSAPMQASEVHASRQTHQTEPKAPHPFRANSHQIEQQRQFNASQQQQLPRQRPQFNAQQQRPVNSAPMNPSYNHAHSQQPPYPHPHPHPHPPQQQPRLQQQPPQRQAAGPPNNYRRFQTFNSQSLPHEMHSDVQSQELYVQESPHAPHAQQSFPRNQMQRKPPSSLGLFQESEQHNQRRQDHPHSQQSGIPPYANSQAQPTAPSFSRGRDQQLQQPFQLHQSNNPGAPPVPKAINYNPSNGIQQVPSNIPPLPPNILNKNKANAHPVPSSAGSSNSERSRLQPITTTDPSSAPVSQRYQQSPTVPKHAGRSPILQQGINLFSRNSRTVTSPVMSASSSFQNTTTGGSNAGRSMSLNSSSFKNFISSSSSDSLSSKHHSKDHQQKTSSGRVIPQKFEMGNSSGLGLKTRSLSSIAKARRVSSSASLNSHRISSQGSLSSKTLATNSSRAPQVYPAILSRVATLFKKTIVLAQYNKDGLEYRDAFTGADAVDVIAHIIRTTDRNLALLLGRALDAQKLFHDVTYEHRLRDSVREIYQFSETYVSTQPGGLERNGSVASETTLQVSETSSTSSHSASDHTVNGIFTLLTECYSPTCTREALCYSIACPRRLEQQARLNMKPQGGLKRNESRASLHDEDEKKQLWSHTVSKQLLESLDKREIKRQELIYEVVATERTFVKNLEYLRDFWIRPLRESNIIPYQEREKFIRTVFFNVIEILSVAIRFRDALARRQQLKPVVENIGDIFLEFIPYFEPFVSYNAGQCFAKYELERQKVANPLFSRFVEDTERLPESNRLNISSYLSQATTRTVRYNLFLRDILKSTVEDSIDLPDLQKASDLILKLLERINIKVGKAEDRHALILLKQRLVFRPGEYVDLKLGAENRKIIYTAPLKRKNQDKDTQGDIQVYLLDHLLLFVRVKVINKREQHKVYQRPIPLPLLYVSATEEMPSLRPYTRKAGAYAHVLHHPSRSDSKFPISVAYVGRRGYELTLYGATNSAQDSLISVIEEQQKKIRDANDIFTLTPLAERFFDISNRMNCLSPCDGGRKLIYGTDSGVFMSEIKTRGNERIVSKPVKIINKVNVTQLEVLEEYQTLLALADKKLYAWPLELLTVQDQKSGKELMSHVSFFKVGICAGRILVCAAKSDLIRVFEPTDPFSKKMSKKKFKSETKEYHFSSEPVSISFLKTRLIVGCTKGFDIVSLNDSKIEPILDPADTSLDFISNKEGLKPLTIHRIGPNFLLSYSDFSFYINKNGWRTKADWIINWEGIPQNFALWYPYLLAFEPNFIEIRHVETGELLRVIMGENIRFLHTGSQEILYAYEDERGYDIVASLDFWDKTAKKTPATTNPSVLSDIKEVDEKK